MHINACGQNAKFVVLKKMARAITIVLQTVKISINVNFLRRALGLGRLIEQEKTNINSASGRYHVYSRMFISFVKNRDMQYVRGAKKYQTNNGKTTLCRLSCTPNSLHRKAENTLLLISVYAFLRLSVRK